MKETYTLIRSKRKTVGIQIGDKGEIIVRAGTQVRIAEIERILDEHREWIRTAQERVLQKNRILTRLDEADLTQLRREAKNTLPQKAAYYAEKMGLQYNRISITAAKGRFGSCSSKKNICFSLYLMLYPEDAIDYVVVHELAHLLEMNHSPRFYAVVESVLPDWQRRKALLRPEYMKPYL